MVIKNGLTSCYKKLMIIQTLMYVAAGIFLLAGIFNIIRLKKFCLWLVLLRLEAGKNWPSDSSGGEAFTMFNILVMLTTLTNCLIYFIVGVVCMQSNQS